MNKKLTLILICNFILIFFSLTAFSGTNGVASVNGKTYASVQDAVNHMKSGQTLKLLKPRTTSETVTIDLGKKKICLQFAGNGYHYTGEETAFEIKSGNVAAKGMKLKSDRYTFYIHKGAALKMSGGGCSGLIRNEGKLTFSDGKYKNLSIDNYNDLVIRGGTFTPKKEFKMLLVEKGGKAVIYKGVFKVSKNNVIEVKKSGTLEIHKGTFSSDHTCLYSAGKTTINGGTFTSKKAITIVNAKGTMKINGGTVKGKSQYILISNENGNMTINSVKVNGCIANDCSGKKKMIINGGSFNGETWNKKGKMVINGGNFVNTDNTVIYNDGDLEITGGSFILKSKKNKKDPNHYTLFNYGKAVLTGGTFRKGNNGDTPIGNRYGRKLTRNENVDGEDSTVYTISEFIFHYAEK